MYKPHFPTRWDYNKLFIFHGIAALLLASWLFSASRDYWVILNEAFYFWLNGSLEQGLFTRIFWALANTREADVIPFAIMLCFLLKSSWIFEPNRIRIGAVGFVIALFFLLIIRFVLGTFADIFMLSGPSPSLVLEPSYRLIDMFPQWDTKDRANHSFPGDHSAVLFLWAGYIGLYVTGLKRLIVFLLALLLMFPRWVSGAHWLTDSLVGGGFIALVALAWYMYTPLAAKIYSFLLPLINHTIGFLVKIKPELQRWPLFRI